MKKIKLSIQLIPIYGLVFLMFLLVTFIGNHTITTLSESSVLTDRHTIVIDAGHGGEDGGATSCTGILESNLNLEIALRLNDLLRFMGYQTYMVRTTDTALHTQGDTIAARKASDLKARVAIAENTDNCIWISIHQNYFSDDRYSGAQVFYAGTSGSDNLGKQLQNNIIKYLNPFSHRQAKQITGIYLFEHLPCIGILVECGFISNREEEALLSSNTYQKKLIIVIAASVGSFLS